MKPAVRVVFSALTSIFFVGAGWALTSTTTNDNALSKSATQEATAETQSVSGKITSVASDSFTLTVGAVSTSTPREEFQDQPKSSKTMTFHIDRNTTVEGKLKVNANADVTYREENGNYLAISVRVTS
jgi:ribosomal protein S1